MQDILKKLSVDTQGLSRQIAYQFQSGADDARVGIMFLGGFRSDMMGSKAQYLAEMAKDQNRAFIRFDYSGHGQSSADFLKCTMTHWLDDCVAIFEALADRPFIVVGSSMGGWLALLLNKYLRETDRAERAANVAGLVLIAPAVDMTADLMSDTFTPTELAEMDQNNYVTRPSDYGEPYRLTRALIEDGTQHLLFGQTIETGVPVHILQGGGDAAVPVTHAQKLVSHLLLDPVTLTLVPDGDHSLSRANDLDLLGRAIDAQTSTFEANGGL